MRPSARLMTQARRAADRMADDTTCTVRRVTGQTFDPATGAYVDTTVVVYTGPCRIRQQTWQQSSENRTESRIVTTTVNMLSLPFATSASADVQVDDVATIDSCVWDAAMVGREYRVRQVPSGSHLSARRMIVEEQQT